MYFGVEGGFIADKQDVRNNFEIVASLLEGIGLQIKK